MIQNFKSNFQSMQVKSMNTLIFGLILFGLVTLISKKSKQTQLKSEKNSKSSNRSLSSSNQARVQAESYSFQLSIVKRSYLIELLELINYELLERLVGFI